jgi:hypothetical protein
MFDSKGREKNISFIKILNYAIIAIVFSIALSGCDATKTDAVSSSTSNEAVAPPKIEVKEDVKTDEIVFETQQQDDPTLEKAQTKVKQEGKNGAQVTVSKVTYTDGKETNRAIVSQSITVQPVTKIVLIGTKTVQVSAPASTTQVITQSNSGGVVKKSSTSICHAPGTTYYDRTTNYTPYNSLDACLASGGRLPKK